MSQSARASILNGNKDGEINSTDHMRVAIVTTVELPFLNIYPLDLSPQGRIRMYADSETIQ